MFEILRDETLEARGRLVCPGCGKPEFLIVVRRADWTDANKAVVDLSCQQCRLFSAAPSWQEISWPTPEQWQQRLEQLGEQET
jgi:hypothetical protein